MVPVALLFFWKDEAAQALVAVVVAADIVMVLE